MKFRNLFLLSFILFLFTGNNWAQKTKKQITRSSSATDKRWSVEKANTWYDAHKWMTGADYIPSTAINQLEMWQASTFDPVTIDRELGWAENIGFNTMRVF